MSEILRFAAFVLFLMVVIFLPFDWWQKAPSRQKDRFLGKLLGGVVHISLRNIVLRTLILGFSVWVYLLSLFWLFCMAVPFAAGAILLSLYLRIFRRDVGNTIPVTGLVVILVIASMFAIGILSPLRVIPVAGYLALSKPAGNAWEGLTVGAEMGMIDGIIGLCGLFGVASWLILDAVWRMRQYHQIRNIATSKVRSIATGIVELRGTVKPVAGARGHSPVEIRYSALDMFNARQKVERFILDDGTGSVVVDATGCRVRKGWVAEVAAIFGVREIVLRRRAVHDEFSDTVTRSLIYGDRIYVIGHAERENGGELVVRPAARPGWNEIFWKTIFGALVPPKGKDIHDVFFLTDGDEALAAKHILKGFRTVLLWALVWIAASVAIIGTSQQPWRQAPPLDSWRNAYWRGPDPNPDTSVIDYARNQRLFRFERYIGTVGTESYDQVPALLEAMGYRDYRFREPATRALIGMMPAVNDRAREAVPLLIAHLHPCAYNPRSLRMTIRALGTFGADAVPAVPALIEQLTCSSTNTYEVSPNMIRAEAAWALGEVGPAAQGALPALRERLNDPSPDVREQARTAVGKIDENTRR